MKSSVRAGLFITGFFAVATLFLASINSNFTIGSREFWKNIIVGFFLSGTFGFMVYQNGTRRPIYCPKCGNFGKGPWLKRTGSISCPLCKTLIDQASLDIAKDWTTNPSKRVRGKNKIWTRYEVLSIVNGDINRTFNLLTTVVVALLVVMFSALTSGITTMNESGQIRQTVFLGPENGSAFVTFLITISVYTLMVMTFVIAIFRIQNRRILDLRDDLILGNLTNEQATQRIWHLHNPDLEATGNEDNPNVPRL